MAKTEYINNRKVKDKPPVNFIYIPPNIFLYSHVKDMIKTSRINSLTIQGRNFAMLFTAVKKERINNKILFEEIFT